MTEANISNLSNAVAVPTLPKVMSAKTFNRIYGGHETLGGVYKLHQKIVAELLSTLLFVFGVISCSYYYGAEYPLASMMGCSAIGGVMIYIFGRVSGAHFNPAISLALFIRQKLSAMEFGLYVAAQIVGAFLGCLFFVLVRRGKFTHFAGNEIQWGVLDSELDKDGWSYMGAFIMEIILTFILIMFILASCERDNYLGPSLGLAFSLTLLACSVIGGGVSGCSMNPARSLAPAFMQLFNGTYKNPIKQIWIYLVGPLLGAVIAAFVWPVFIYQ